MVVAAVGSRANAPERDAGEEEHPQKPTPRRRPGAHRWARPQTATAESPGLPRFTGSRRQPDWRRPRSGREALAQSADQGQPGTQNRFHRRSGEPRARMGPKTNGFRLLHLPQRRSWLDGTRGGTHRSGARVAGPPAPRRPGHTGFLEGRVWNEPRP